MGALATGTVVLVPFPFSDLSESKLRPAVVLANAGRGDFVLCQVTSNAYADPLAIQLSTADFPRGSLRRTSYARAGKLFTASGNLVVRQVGELRPAALDRIVATVVSILVRAPEDRV